MNRILTTLKVGVWGVLCIMSLADKGLAQGELIERPIGTTKAPWGFLEYLPTSYNDDPSKEFPVIFALSGIGEKGSGNFNDLQIIKRLGIPKIIVDGNWPVRNRQGNLPAEQFIVIAPQSFGGFYNFEKLKALVDETSELYRIDEDRIYVVGLSAGAFSTYEFMDKYPGVPAAAIAVAGKGVGQIATACDFKHIPLWAFHGTSDGTVNYQNSVNIVNAINACSPAPNPKAKLTLYTGVGHNSWQRTYDLTGMDSNLDANYDPFDISIYDWLLQFSKDGPVANAGPDQELFLPINSTNLTGSGSVAGGSIVSYQWTKINGPQVTLSNANTPTVTLSDMVAGVYNFRLTITDNIGATDTDDVVVLVSTSNQLPIADAGEDITLVLPTNSINITGRGSDPDGSISSYGWEKVDGPFVNISGANSAVLSLSGMEEGEYTFRLNVTDNDGASASDEVIIRVDPPAINQPPTADVGEDITVFLPTNSVNITGQGSDTDGDVVSYLWEKITGPTATIINPNNAEVTIEGLQIGVYEFELTVTDDDGASGSDRLLVTVEDSNQPPTADAGDDIRVDLPVNTVNIEGEGTDVDGNVESYLWAKVSGGSANLVNAEQSILTVDDLEEGTYVFSLTVTDDDGAAGYDEVMVTVVAAAVNVPPTVGAGANQTITLPVNSTTLIATANDSDGSIEAYLWVQDSGPSATLNGEDTNQLIISDMVVGTYVFEVEVMDDDGASASDMVQIIVLPEIVNQAPVANAGMDREITLPTNSIVLTGVGTDVDGTIEEYGWAQLSGSIVVLSGESTSELEVSNMVEGVYEFELTVTDNDGAVDSDIVQVTVNTVNKAPLADAGEDKIATLPVSSVTITGSGSDPDGVSVTYLWSVESGPSGLLLTNETTESVIATNMVEGVYTIRLTVTDVDGATGYDDMKLTVNTVANQKPIANAGMDREVFLPTASITITGKGSDADGTVTDYEWSKVSGPDLTLVNADNASVTLRDLLEGVYVLRLMVTDDDGATGFDDVSVTVIAEINNQDPTANAGPDRVVNLPTTTITLSGSGSDSDGTISSYQWKKVSGPSAVLVNENTANLTLQQLVEGAYIFRLTVTDNDAASDVDEVKVTVIPEAINESPKVNAGPDIEIVLPINNVSIFGSASDGDGTIASYLWSKQSGGDAILSNESTPTLSVTGLEEGVYVFRLAVSDDDGASSFDEVSVTVVSAVTNLNPFVDAGEDKIIKLPTSSASVSGFASDQDGFITTYDWIKVSGGAVTMSNQASATMLLTDLGQGKYVFRLTVTDDDGASSFDEVSVNVLPEETNQSPNVNAGEDQLVYLPNGDISLNAVANDPDGSIVNYLWEQVVGPAIQIDNVGSPTIALTFEEDGNYEFRVTVNDDDGASSVDEVEVTVFPEAVNQPPTASAGDGDVEVFLPEDNVVLRGSGNDEDGTITAFGWSKLSGPSVTLSGTNTSVLTLSNMVEGVYTLRLTVTDDDGDKGTDDIKVTVFPASINRAPTAIVGEDVFLILPENSTTLNGSGTDTDGTITSYFWEKLTGPAVNLSGEDTADLLISEIQSEGEYRFRFTVFDNDGSSASAEVSVYVEQGFVSMPPIADAGEDVTLQLPKDSVTLVGMGSDGDGLIFAYEWMQLEGPNIDLSGVNNIELPLTSLKFGQYKFQLEVTDNDNLKGTDDIIVNVISQGDAFTFPKLISPNGDGVNDFWEVEDLEAVAECKLIIYDQNGGKVFEAMPYQNTWNGSGLREGAYYYVFKCEGDVFKSGGIRLVR